jgi:uncharacterized protein (DUF934 family)
MPKIIVDGAVVEDNWRILGVDEFDSLEQLAEGNYLLPVEAWNQINAAVKTPPLNLGIWIASTEVPEQIEGDFQNLAVIAVDFPVFADGRGFSIGRLLRQRYGYRGQLRAIGRPIRDQLSYMIRCGFNAFALAEHYDPELALQSLKDFSESYQSAVDQPVPLYRRRG